MRIKTELVFLSKNKDTSTIIENNIQFVSQLYYISDIINLSIISDKWAKNIK